MYMCRKPCLITRGYLFKDHHLPSWQLSWYHLQMIPFFIAILIYHKVSNEVENDSTRWTVLKVFPNSFAPCKEYLSKIVNIHIPQASPKWRHIYSIHGALSSEMFHFKSIVWEEEDVLLPKLTGISLTQPDDLPSSCGITHVPGYIR